MNVGITPTTRSLCAKCVAAGFTDGRCAYCNVTLSPRHEHDHFPVPRRAGGEEIIPVCLNCHDLKDRCSFEDWDHAEFLKQLGDAPPLARIMLASLLSDLHAFRAGESA